MDRKTCRNVIATLLSAYDTKGMKLTPCRIDKGRFGIEINLPVRDNQTIGSLAEYHRVCASEDPKRIAAVLEAIQECEI